MSWERYDRMFGNTRVKAYVIMRGAEHVGSIGIKYPKDGAGRLQVAVWEKYAEPQYGNASGCGYDKRSAALRGLTMGGHVFQDRGAGWESELIEAGMTVIAAIMR